MNKVTAALILVGSLLTATAGYAVYFDYKRRNDPDFRRRLRKTKKRAQKDKQATEITQEQDLARMIASSLKIANQDQAQLPTTIDGKEKYFMEQVAKGEALVPNGASSYEESAAHFYRALRVYPNPIELIMIYQKTLPEVTFNIVMGMMTFDLQKKQEKYYEQFPPPEMHVKLILKEDGTAADGTKVKRRAMVLTRGVQAGETIFAEEPVVTCLKPALEGKGWCHHCLGKIIADTPFTCNTCDASQVQFCSEACRDAALDAYHPALCTGVLGDGSDKAREFRDYVVAHGDVSGSMIAKLFAKTIADEQKRVASGAMEAEEFGIWEHLERLRYLELLPGEDDKQEKALILRVMANTIPGIEEFITEERFLTLKGKILYNGLSVYGDASVEPSDTPVKSRGSQDLPVIGTALYLYSSYPRHTCEPNIEFRFNDNSAKVSAVALKDLAEGDELFASWVPTTANLNDRRAQLKHWRYRCECARCKREELLAAAQAAAQIETAGKAAAETTPEEESRELDESGVMVTPPPSEIITPPVSTHKTRVIETYEEVVEEVEAEDGNDNTLTETVVVEVDEDGHEHVVETTITEVDKQGHEHVLSSVKE